MLLHLVFSINCYLAALLMLEEYEHVTTVFITSHSGSKSIWMPQS